MQYESKLINKVFDDCWGLYDSLLKSFYTKDELVKQSIRQTLQMRTGLREYFFIHLGACVATYCNDRLYYSAATQQRKSLRKEWNTINRADRPQWYAFVMANEYKHKNFN